MGAEHSYYRRRKRGLSCRVYGPIIMLNIVAKADEVGLGNYPKYRMKARSARA